MSSGAAAYAEKRLAANRANSQHSTGPRTDEGKLRSAMNALKHGLTAISPILPTEDRAAYDRHIQEFIDEYKPTTCTEKQLALDLAETAWRINRIPAIEAGILALEAEPGSINTDVPDLETSLAVTEALRRQERTLNAISTHGHRLHRQFHKTLEQLRNIQADRRREELHDLRRAAAVFHVQKKQGLPYDPAQDGFVFSTEQLQAFLDRSMRHEKATNAESWFISSRAR
ncbi:MAG TPA: hypothetical protein VGV35_05865 [Bryobacteraceae bacterium]|nr:hypothetical protein [Bryobacteraceae bacterium]